MVTAADALPDDVDSLKAALLAERARSADATAIAEHPRSALDDLLPWNWAAAAERRKLAA